MKRRILAWSLVIMTVLGGCWGCREQKKESRPQAASSSEALGTGDGENADGGQQIPQYVQPEMKGEITVSVMYDMEFLTKAAENFMKQYPDIRIDIHTAMELSDSDVNGSGGMEEYRTELNTRIMSGKAEDIICTQLLPVRRYMEMGAFEDLSSYMAAAPELKEENYFMNVLEAAKDKDGHIYILPYKSSFDVIGFEEKLVAGEDYFKDKDSLRFSEAAAYAKQKMDAAGMKNTYLSIQGSSGYMQSLIREYRDTLLDLENKKVDINTEQYINWLKEVKELEDQGYFNPPDLNFYNTEYYFAMTEDYDVQAGFYELYPGDLCQGKPAADAKGNVYTSSSDCFAINSASQNKGIAWEFIRYLLSPEVQSHPSMASVGLPVNREGFAAAAERTLSVYTDGTKTSIAAEDYKALMERWVSQINRCNLIDSAVYGYFGEENDKFFEGKQTAEQTAQNLQNKLTQYLRE